MLTPRLSSRTARFSRSSRGGFTLVELLVVIGIIAILAGVALGPITNGIKQAKHNAAMQTGRQLGQVCFSYSTDNTANGNSYPCDSAAWKIAQNLLNAGYISDPSIFIVSGQTGISNATAAGATITMAPNHISWSFTVADTSTTTGGITSNASDLIPIVYFNNGANTPIPNPFPANPGTAKTARLQNGAPFGMDGIAVFYKGNNALYIKAGTGGIQGQVENFISANCLDTTAYQIAP